MSKITREQTKFPPAVIPNSTLLSLTVHIVATMIAIEMIDNSQDRNISNYYEMMMGWCVMDDDDDEVWIVVIGYWFSVMCVLLAGT